MLHERPTLITPAEWLEIQNRIDKYFPKGNKQRGDAIMLIAEVYFKVLKMRK